MTFRRAIPFLCVVLCCCVCLSAAPLAVVVSIAPMREAVEAVGGDQVVVRVLLPSGGSPETYQPDARTIRALGNARLLFTVGVPFEDALLPKLRAAFPNVSVVDGMRGCAFRTFEDGGRDPHCWLAPANMSVYAENVARELSIALPEKAAFFQERLTAYRGMLQELAGRLQTRLSPLSGKTVLVFHPAFGYFFDSFGIRQSAIEEEGKEPTARELQARIREAKALGLPAIFVQPQFSPRSAQTLARELGCHVVKLDPLPEKYSSGLEALADAVADAYSL